MGPRIYKVAELVKLAARALEARFADVWVEGEISNLRAPGHVYFTLKDEGAQLAAVMFRAEAARLKFRLADGQKVRARGRLSIYAESGKFQFYADFLEPVGLGALQLAFEQLKRKLAAEGLFDETRKRPLPFLPRRIGVATSPTGAAVRDIIRVVSRRAPARIVVAPCQVQGESAPREIVAALQLLQRTQDVDVIIVGRGGGSIEDLWAFNDEIVARAIAACRVPVISAVGHEVDFTIADFVADRRAATPSQAGEMVVPVHAELGRALDELSARLVRTQRRRVGVERQALDERGARLRRGVERNLASRHRALASLAQRLQQLHPRAQLAARRARLDRLASFLVPPVRERIARRRRELAALERRLLAAMQQTMSRRARAFRETVGKLDALSPLRVLERGYGLVSAGGHVVTSTQQLAVGDAVEVRLADGRFMATVDTVGKK